MSYENCHGFGAGMKFGDPCPDCAHVVGMHTWPDRVCAACQGLDEIRQALKSIHITGPVTPTEGD